MEPPALMVLYGGGCLEARSARGSRLRLSACGSEYRLGRAAAAARQRVPFAVRGRREQLLQALDFRNKFSARPYLPSNIIPPERKKILLSDIFEVRWPDPATTDLTTCINNSNVKISSVDGYAHLYLSELQQEFTVEFLCKVSQPSPASLRSSQKSNHQTKNQCGQSSKNAVPEMSSRQVRTETKESEHGCAESKYREPTKPKDQKDRDEVPLFFTSCSSEYTWVTQQWSVSSYPEEWKYPLSLALMLLTPNSEMETHEENSHTSIGSDVLEDSETYEKVSRLPTALPLSCSAPHLHRWSFCDFFQQNNEESEKHSYPQLIQIVWCQGVFYRFIHGNTTIVEIYPDDGTFFKSEGTFLGKYFKHYTIQKGTKKREEKMYSVNSLPPDVPGSPYSISSIITQATKMLQYCYKAKLSLTHNYSICCWKTVNENVGWCKLTTPDGVQQLIQLSHPGIYERYIRTVIEWCRNLNDREKVSEYTTCSVNEENWSADAELEKIQRFNFLLENSNVLKRISADNSLSGITGRKTGNVSTPKEISKECILEALEKTSKVIQDIESLLASSKK
ncbi:uncharacterized protein C5orf34 homolog isoform X3 [Rhea pennata]|uniref:uncharacterized protein C5orf34 homolog isoform X3 n=1 Tax=Rhea pennata TaxID=8795 RepID=UPI002E26A5F4